MVTRRQRRNSAADDAVLAGVNDIRVGTSFARADLIAMHPTTWLNLRTTPTTTGAYVLDQWQTQRNARETLDSFFGVRVVQLGEQVPSIYNRLKATA